MKKVMLFIILLFPSMVLAECDYDAFMRASALAGEVNYETNYNASNGKFDITFYNVVDEIYLSFNNSLYYGDDSNIVTIKNLDEGYTAKVYIKASGSGCASDITVRHVTLPYYNNFYGSNVCKGYEELTPCASEFLSYKNSLTIIEDAISNSESIIDAEAKDEENGNTVTIKDNLIDFGKNWAVKLLLVIITTFITITIYKSYFRKVKHGI